MKKIEYIKTKKNIKDFKKYAVDFRELEKSFTKEQRKQLEKEKRYYETLMNLKESRKKKNLTQEKLAKRARIPRTTVSKIESGNRNVTIETLMNLAKAMGKKLEIRFV